MHVAVLGAGVIGVTTAYYLTEAGHTVAVLDREDQVANACSFANGAQLSYSYTDAMATPGFLATIPRLLAGLDAGIRFRAPLSADLLRWGRAFLAECTTRKATANTLETLLLAQRSKLLLARLGEQLDGDFAYRPAGKIVLLANEKDRQDALRSCELKASHGCATSVISLDEAIDIEPAIQHMTGEYRAAVYAAGDDVGDANTFSSALARRLLEGGQCSFQLSTNVRRVVTEDQRVRGIETDCGVLDADAVVVCLGAWSPRILKPLGIWRPVIPARGYSITLRPGPHANSVSVTDLARRLVIGRIGEQMRVAGFADFVGYKTTRDTHRISQLITAAQRCAPRAADYSTSPNQAWGGFRPLTPNGQPLIGATPVNGLYLNTGHGSLGWTLACASGELLVNSMLPAGQSRTNYSAGSAFAKMPTSATGSQPRSARSALIASRLSFFSAIKRGS